MSTDQQPDVTSLGQLRLIDLSVSLEQDAAGEMMKPQIEYVTHAGAGLQSMMAVFRARPEDFIYSNGQGWAVENLSVNGHAGTHVDAPYHYGAFSEGPSGRWQSKRKIGVLFARLQLPRVLRVARGRQ